jgi:hypothetical protein
MRCGNPSQLIRAHGGRGKLISSPGSSERVPRDARKRFTDRVKAIDPVFRKGDLETFWPLLRGLVAMAPERRDLSIKKSHYLAGLAARSLHRGEPEAALAFLEFADHEVHPEHMTPFLRREREEFRQRARRALEPGGTPRE